MKVINFGEQRTIINRYMAELRDVNIQNDRSRFRHNLQRIGQLMAFEVSKTLEYKELTVQTPLGKATATVPNEEPVLATIFRAGLPFHQGFLDVFDAADNAFVSAYRYYRDKECHDVDIHIEYIASPDLTDKTLIIADPMLATGGSMELGYQALLTKGKPKEVHFCSVIASRQGVEFLEKLFADTNITLWCADIDPELNDHMYIVPGLGDAGDLAYGGKI